jgi:hypothetical protein
MYAVGAALAATSKYLAGGLSRQGLDRVTYLYVNR